MRFSPLGDRAVTITLGDSIDEATHQLVRAVSAAIDASPPRGFVDQVPAFASVTVHYEPRQVAVTKDQTPHGRMVADLDRLISSARVESPLGTRVVEIPVCYGGELGPDLQDVARQHDIEPDDVVRLHSGGDYLVYMVGFMPGFAYLGGLSERLATPRRATPRAVVPAGAVGIGGRQTGVYPLESPGGWNLIGRTPVRVFDLAREEPILLATGDRVRFHPISAGEFTAWPLEEAETKRTGNATS